MPRSAPLQSWRPRQQAMSAAIPSALPQPLEHELLHPPSFVLAGVDVPLRVDGDVGDVMELTRIVTEAADGPHDLQTLPIENPDLLIAAGDVQEALISVRRKGQRDDGAGRRAHLARDERLLHERSVGPEHLDAVVRS